MQNDLSSLVQRDNSAVVKALSNGFMVSFSGVTADKSYVAFSTYYKNMPQVSKALKTYYALPYDPELD